MEVRYTLPEGAATVGVDRAGTGLVVTILRPDRPPAVYEIEQWGLRQGRLIFQSSGRRWAVCIAKDGQARLAALEGQSWRLEPPRPIARQREAGGGGLAAAMPGKVLDVLVQPGQEVAAGATLIVIEAMKMELRITAPAAGVVAQLFVSAGEVVDQGQRLIEFRSST